jgi:hypothetical protein
MTPASQFPPIDPAELARIMDDPEAAGLPVEQPVEQRGVSGWAGLAVFAAVILFAIFI